MGRTYDKQHATTVVLTEDTEAKRLVCFNGCYPPGETDIPASLNDVCGVSEYGGMAGQAISVITGYSAVVTAGGEIAAGRFVKPDANGKVVEGSLEEHCGRALDAASGDGDEIEILLLPHVHPEA